MCDILQATQSRRGGVRLALGLCAIVAFGAPRLVEAHNILSEFIQHGVHLTVGAQHMDVTVDLTFFEEWSAREREVMDADDNGSITRAEQEIYLRKLAPEISKHVKLRVAGREVTLVPLYDPEVDLLADDKVGPAHHRLRVFFFAPTPALRAGDEIVIEDSFWPEAKALATPQTEGHDGSKLTTLVSLEAGLTPARARQGEAHRFKFHCLEPPTKAAEPTAHPTRSATAAATTSASPQQLKPSSTRPEL